MPKREAMVARFVRLPTEWKWEKRIPSWASLSKWGLKGRDAPRDPTFLARNDSRKTKRIWGLSSVRMSKSFGPWGGCVERGNEAVGSLCLNSR